MRKFVVGEDAVSPVIGVVLMVGMTVIMISAVAVSVFAFSVPESAPEARIVVVEAKGDTNILYKNMITLKHKGGDPLYENNTKIIVIGIGYAYTGTSPASPVEDIQVNYNDLSGDNYGGIYGSNLGEIVEGDSFDAGESIILYGYDGKNIGSFFNQGNNVDCKWKLQPGSEVVVTIIDIPTNQVIATSRVIVKNA